MKTLDQIEPRTPLAGGTSTVTISQDGSYYLTGNITVAGGDGITINATNVTLDLNGFTISTSAPGVGGNGISFPGLGSLTVRNGRIRSGTTFNAGSNTFASVGFSNGISVDNSNAAGVRIENVSVIGVAAVGINVIGSAVVSHCKVDVAATNGIFVNNASTVDHCVATECGGAAITGDDVSDCTGTSIFGIGIAGRRNANNCYGQAINANNSNGAGVSTGEATNCHGTTLGRGAGLIAITAANSYGNSGGDGYGISTRTALNCYASSGGGTALLCNTATNCVAQTSGSTSSVYAIDCNTDGVATGCKASAGSSTAYVIRAKIANGCALGTGSQALITNKINSF